MPQTTSVSFSTTDAKTAAQAVAGDIAKLDDVLLVAPAVFNAAGDTATLTDIGLRSRVGKGACQGAFCAVRTVAHLYQRGDFQARRGLAEILDFFGERWRGLEARTRAASARAEPLFTRRGQLLPRDRIALLIDPASPWLELSALAGFGKAFDGPAIDPKVL